MAWPYIKHITFLNHYTAAQYAIRTTMVRFIIHTQQEIMHIVVFAVTDYSGKSVYVCGMAIPIAVLLTSFHVHTTHYNINLYTRFYLVGMGLQAILCCCRDL